MTITSLKCGETALVLRVLLDGALKSRLKSLGVCEGKQIFLSKISFWGSTYLLRTEECRVGLRKSVANCIFVQPVKGATE
jgi:Fe2+ transport system protein FeoA